MSFSEEQRLAMTNTLHNACYTLPASVLSNYACFNTLSEIASEPL